MLFLIPYEGQVCPPNHKLNDDNLKGNGMILPVIIILFSSDTPLRWNSSTGRGPTFAQWDCPSENISVEAKPYPWEDMPPVTR